MCERCTDSGKSQFDGYPANRVLLNRGLILVEGQEQLAHSLVFGFQRRGVSSKSSNHFFLLFLVSRVDSVFSRIETEPYIVFDLAWVTAARK